MENTNLYGLLQELRSLYLADGQRAPLKRMANDIGVDPSYVSKWLGTKKNGPQTPDARFAVKIYDLYAKKTGKPAVVPITSRDFDPNIEKVISIMETMDQAHREAFAQAAEFFPRK